MRGQYHSDTSSYVQGEAQEGVEEAHRQSAAEGSDGCQNEAKQALQTSHGVLDAGANPGIARDVLSPISLEAMGSTIGVAGSIGVIDTWQTGSGTSTLATDRARVLAAETPIAMLQAPSGISPPGDVIYVGKPTDPPVNGIATISGPIPNVGSNLTFTLNNVGGVTVGSQAEAGFQAAAALWSSYLGDAVNIRLNVGFSSLGGSILGQAGSTSKVVSYSAFRSSLIADQESTDDTTANANLQAGPSVSFYTNNSAGTRLLDNDTTANNTFLSVNTANLKALGITTDANGSAVDDGVTADANITFNSDFTFDFDPTDGISAGAIDFVGVAFHEIGHSLGFVSGVDRVDYYSGSGSGAPFDLNGFAIFSALDMFRFSASGVSDLSYGGSTYFSINGGATNLGLFSTGVENGDGRQASHWKDNLGLGIMDPTAAPAGQAMVVTPLDIRAMDVIGWDLATPNGGTGNVTINNVSVAEGNAGTINATFTVTRAGGTGAFDINYATASGTATLGTDFLAASGTLSFGASDNARTVSVTINGDTNFEPDETFFVNLSGATAGAVVTDAQGVGTITNDDAVADDFTPDSIATNGVITVGSSQTGNIGTAGDRDWFRVTLTAGAAVSIRQRGAGTSGGTLVDPYVRLMNSSGTELAFDDDDTAAGTLDSLLIYSPSASGTYYIVAGDFGDTDTGTFTASIGATFSEGADSLSIEQQNASWSSLGGNDTLIGSAGNDTLNGGNGADSLVGGDGGDRFIATTSDGNDTLTGGDGFDVLDFSAVGGVVQVNQFAGTVTGSAGNDTLTDVFEQVIGTAFGDVLAGGNGINVLDGNGGADLLYGNGGQDLLRGGDGGDTFFMQTADGNDTIEGGAGFDLLDFSTAGGVIQLNMFTNATTGTAGNDTFSQIEYVIGSNFGDVIAGNNGVNAFEGGGGADQLFGNGGVDWMRGGTGNDTVILGTGNDTYYFRNGEGIDTINDFVAGGTDDNIDLTTAATGYASFAAMQGFVGAIVQSGADTFLNLDPGGGSTDRIILKNVTATNLTAADFTF